MNQILIASIPFFVALVPLLQYAHQKRVEFKNDQFNRYHDLIKRLVKGDPEDKNVYDYFVMPYIDRQVAIIYELRNFPKYYEVTYRILEGLRKTWIKNVELERVIEEIDHTLNYILRNQGNPSKIWNKEHWYWSDKRPFLAIPARRE